MNYFNHEGRRVEAPIHVVVDRLGFPCDDTVRLARGERCSESGLVLRCQVTSVAGSTGLGGQNVRFSLIRSDSGGISFFLVPVRRKSLALHATTATTTNLLTCQKIGCVDLTL